MSYTDPNRQREYQRAWVKRRRAAYMAGKSCEWCGSTRLLEVDHIDPKAKVSHRIWSWTAERRDEELAKCQILCHDCHAWKTWHVDIGVQPCGTWAKYRRGCRCIDCTAANAARVRAQRARKAA